MTVAHVRADNAVPTPSRRSVSLLTAGIVAMLVGLAGFAFGQLHPRVHEEVTSCLSAPGSISCELDDGWTVSVPKDVTWTDANGTHMDGRPDCLPPSGTGLEGPVRLGVVPVSMDGMTWRQVVWVAC